MATVIMSWLAITLSLISIVMVYIIQGDNE